ncbi:MAG: ComF family protein [Gammaproteobacteria bacterium]|nr:ComF family protein [Gammaproteobacteria bacterium]
MVNNWPIIDHLFGASCPLCAVPGAAICPACHANLPFNRHACRRCALPLPREAPPASLCAACLRDPPGFDAVTAPLLYTHPVDDLVARLKYRHELFVGRILADVLSGFVNTGRDMPDVLVPVAASANRLRSRGFNQAAEIARHLGKQCRLPVASDLLRRRDSAHTQRGLGRRARRGNIRGVFECRQQPPGHVALVDDVMTTGATANEASRVLRRAGATRIDVWVVARTPEPG